MTPTTYTLPSLRLELTDGFDVLSAARGTLSFTFPQEVRVVRVVPDTRIQADAAFVSFEPEPVGLAVGGRDVIDALRTGAFTSFTSISRLLGPEIDATVAFYYQLDAGYVPGGEFFLDLVSIDGDPLPPIATVEAAAAFLEAPEIENLPSEFGRTDPILLADLPGVRLSPLGEGDDLRIGGQRGERFDGFGGADTLLGAGGDDTVIGQAGDDSLSGGPGADLLSGGDGADALDGGTGDDVLRAGAGDDALSGGPGNDLLEGGPGADALRGGPGADTLDGGAGDDFYVIEGADVVIDGGGIDRVIVTRDFALPGPGIEVLSADGGDDVRLTGSVGDETLLGNGADNVLIGLGGADTMTGYAGADVFVLTDGPDTFVEITDFNRGRPGLGEDRIAIDDRLLGLGNAQIDVRDLAPDVAAGLLRDGVVGYDARRGGIKIDIDRDGTLETVARVDRGMALTVEDVLLF